MEVESYFNDAYIPGEFADLMPELEGVLSTVIPDFLDVRIPLGHNSVSDLESDNLLPYAETHDQSPSHESDSGMSSLASPVYSVCELESDLLNSFDENNSDDRMDNMVTDDVYSGEQPVLYSTADQDLLSYLCDKQSDSHQSAENTLKITDWDNNEPATDITFSKEQNYFKENKCVSNFDVEKVMQKKLLALIDSDTTDSETFDIEPDELTVIDCSNQAIDSEYKDPDVQKVSANSAPKYDSANQCNSSTGRHKLPYLNVHNTFPSNLQPSTQCSIQNSTAATTVKLRKMNSIDTADHSFSSMHKTAHSVDATSQRLRINSGLLSDDDDYSTRQHTSLDKQGTTAPADRNRRNAMLAKRQREKKKSYINKLESELSDVKSKNGSLTKELRRVNRENCALVEELDYLKRVLANDSAISSLIKNIPNVTSISLSNHYIELKRNADHDHDYKFSSPKRVCRPTKTVSSGVCLHVDKENVSVEFCSSCAKRASSSFEMLMHRDDGSSRSC